ncbi:MAG: hypothetical protein FWB87_13730 [Defluviitaleaceae bacterium]|nr:hypothetical protein [Defluviitaleaceae bacterium]
MKLHYVTSQQGHSEYLKEVEGLSSCRLMQDRRKIFDDREIRAGRYAMIILLKIDGTLSKRGTPVYPPSWKEQLGA